MNIDERMERDPSTELGMPTELTAALDANFDHYNNGHEHTSLPKINGRHLTPAQWRASSRSAVTSARIRS